MPLIVHAWSVGDMDMKAAREALNLPDKLPIDPLAYKRRKILRIEKVLHVQVVDAEVDEDDPNADWRKGLIP